MTPQLQQAIKLLALSNLEIETFIGEALEANPLLEAGDMRESDAPGEEASGEKASDGGAEDASGDTALDIDPAALDRDRDTGDWSVPDGGNGPLAGELHEIDDWSGNGPTLTEHLLSQVGGVTENARQEALARHIIAQLDEAGYLPVDMRALSAETGVAEGELTAALAAVQRLDPAGVGARTLSECLVLQAREADRYDPCMARLIDHLDLVARGDFARLKRMCDVDDADFADMLAELRGYDPKPGLQFGGSSEVTVAPDVLLRRVKGKDGAQSWDIRLNTETLPRLVVNRDYYVTLKEGCGPDKDGQAWLGEKLADANWLLKALDQRQKTILKTASEIVKQQAAFFDQGIAGLRPLTLREVADAIDMHESTVSRVTSNKYLHCSRGTFELKFFFTSGVGGGEAGEGASSEAVKARIKALTDAEDAKTILSDDKLVALLKQEGFDLARRTVAKYREAIGIGSSVHRRRAKKLAGLG